MRKAVFFGFLTSLLVMTGSVLADPVVLPTQDYVDKGLRAVYQKIDAAKANKNDVYTKDEIDNAGYLTTADIDAKVDLDDVYTKEEIDNAGYITDENVESGKKYVYTSAGWNAITVEDTFDPDVGG